MFIRYGDHLVLVTATDMLEAEIAELQSKAKLPTKATATMEEGLGVCISRAIGLVDRYRVGSEK